jgi:hypothetical protein
LRASLAAGLGFLDCFPSDLAALDRQLEVDDAIANATSSNSGAQRHSECEAGFCSCGYDIERAAMGHGYRVRKCSPSPKPCGLSRSVPRAKSIKFAISPATRATLLRTMVTIAVALSFNGVRSNRVQAAVDGR